MKLRFKPQVAIWYYKDNRRNYPGFHMTADAVTCQWLKTGLSAEHFNLLAFDLVPATINMLAVPNNRAGAALYVDFTSTRISLDRTLTTAIMINQHHPRIEIVVSGEGKALLVKGLSDIENGEDDYCIGDDGHELWFWRFSERPILRKHRPREQYRSRSGYRKGRR